MALERSEEDLYETEPVPDFFLHEHDWAYYPVFTTYPERHARKCVICGREEQRRGPVYAAFAPDLSVRVLVPETNWEEVTDGS